MEKNVNNSPLRNGESNKNNKHQYAVWKCETADSRMRPLGRMLSHGCRHPNMMRTKLTYGNRKRRWMGVCKQCTRKKSLNGGNVRLFPTKEEAERYIRWMGEEE